MKLKQFQKEDYARMALHDGVVNGQDTGLGKGLAAYIWPILKVGLLRHPDGSPVRPMTPAAPVLIIAAGDLHDQIRKEGRRHFGVVPITLDSQETFLRLSSLSPSPVRCSEFDVRCSMFSPIRTLPPGYYLTTYTQLSRNGITPFPELNRRAPHAMLQALNLTMADVREWFAVRGQLYEKFYTRLQVTPADNLARLTSQWFKLCKHANQFEKEDLNAAYYALKNFAPTRFPRSSPAAPKSDEGGSSSSSSSSSVFTALSDDQQNYVVAEFTARKHAEFTQNIGAIRHYSYDSPVSQLAAPKSDAGGSPVQSSEFDVRCSMFDVHRPIKCVYSPSLADLCSETFAVVVADEAVKIKAEDSLVGLGTRQMNPLYRFPMTATPIKNRLPDVFRLCHWATGARLNAHPRFPYGDADAAEFAEEFMVSERNLTKEEDTGRRYRKLTPQVCSIHRLWKLLAPVILRRPKADCGEELVKKFRHVVRIPMGLHQAATYQYHLTAKYLDVNQRPATGAKLQALRIVAANPASTLLKLVPSSSSSSSSSSSTPFKVQGSKKPTSWPISCCSVPKVQSSPVCPAHVSPYSYIPKLAAVLNLIADILERQEQFIVFSVFHDSLDPLSARLREAGVTHHLLDGRMSAAKRGQLAEQFKRGRPVPVGVQALACSAVSHSPFDVQSSMLNVRCSSPFTTHHAPRTTLPPVPMGSLQSVECMAEGHSYARCPNVILMCYSWALDKILQAIDRIYRLDSLADVNMYAFICDGAIDRKLEDMLKEKSDAAELVLDGHLLGEDPHEVNLADLLEIAEKDFAALSSSASSSSSSSTPFKVQGSKFKVQGSEISPFIDEARLESDWPALRARLAAATQAWHAGSAGIPAGEAPFDVGSSELEVRSSSGLILPFPETETEYADLPLWQQAC